MTLTNALSACCAVAAASMLVGPATVRAVVPPKCTLNASSVHETLAGDCCTSRLTGMCSGPLADATTKKSILMIVADDNSYCHWSFMGGLCLGSSLNACTGDAGCTLPEHCSFGKCVRPCTSNAGCGGGPTGLCVSSDEYKLRNPSSAPPLRLNDPSCRNRESRRAKKQTVTSRCVDQTLDAGDFTFNRGGAPCYKNTADDDGYAITPFVDEIVNRGAVFPRAHVSGNSCKPGRATFLLGRHNRHMAGLNSVDHKSCTAYRGIGCAIDPGEGTSSEVYRSFLFLKGEVATEEQAGFDGGTHGTNGPFGTPTRDCSSTTDGVCGEKVHQGKLPQDGSALAINGIDTLVFDKLETDLNVFVQAGNGNDPRQKTPFFIWFGPNTPHEGGGVGQYFKSLYGLDHGDSKTFFGRISMFDVSVGALLDGLKRRCVCDASGAPKSLFESTIVVFVTDNGFFMPNAKGKNQDNESTQRLPIAISHPDYRSSPKLWTNEMANSADVLWTLEDFAKTGCGSASPYPFARSLCTYVAAGTPPVHQNGLGSTHVRQLQYGHSSGTPFEADGNDSHYLVTRPGLLGVCATSVSGTHVRPCVDNDDCDSSDECVSPATYYMGTCSSGGAACLRDTDCPTASTCTPPAKKGGRCANRPAVACAIDRDCASGLCPSSTTCANTAGSYGDFAPASGGTLNPTQCNSSRPEECTPRGVCQPLVLKVKAKRQGDGTRAIEKVFDLSYDPDERANLLGSDGATNYLDQRRSGTGASLKERFKKCLDAFWCLYDSAACSGGTPTCDWPG